ncbi:MAG: arsenical efflux pump membrane protein ArsB [Candidatus Thermoplasmatota archaeon]|nr:arsenical efflux pump membrane protein ArsB [Candidatus Thermoplasmatota archaeon]
MWRPGNIGIGYTAMTGGVVSVLIGATTVGDVFIVWSIVWNATFTFVAVIILTLIFDEAGFFEYWAARIAINAQGNTKKLFIMIILLGALISAFFANDGTALVLTPIVVSVMTRTGMDKKSIVAFVMAAGFIADTASLPLVISNLVNIVASGYFSISFLHYAEVMILPDISSVLVSIAVLWLLFRRSIPPIYETAKIGVPSEAIKDRIIVGIAVPMIIGLIIAYSIGGIYNLPVSFVAVPSAAFLFLFARFRKKIDTSGVLKDAPWQVVLFSLGMYLTVFGLGREGLTSIVHSALLNMVSLPGPLNVVGAGLLFAFMAAIMNNMPSVMIGNLAIAKFTGQVNSQFIFANVVGNDVGPKFTPIGSLATLLWLHTLERKNSIKIGIAEYMKTGFKLALPVLIVTLVVVWLTVNL